MPAEPEGLNGRCCVFQPFDKGPYDKRYDDILAPAIREAGLEPYRVDRDPGATIPIDTLHDEIKLATICLADIGTHNPNVMYELGYALASGKDAILICPTQMPQPFPFDIRHRSIIHYSLDSPRDFEKLKADIIARIAAILAKNATRNEVSSASPVRETEGLQPHEIASLALVMAGTTFPGDTVSAYSVKDEIVKAGYTALASQLGLSRLVRLKYLEVTKEEDWNGNEYAAYRVLQAGEDWLSANHGKLVMQRDGLYTTTPAFDPGISDDDVPF